MPKKEMTQQKSGPIGAMYFHVLPSSSLMIDGIASTSGRSFAPRQTLGSTSTKPAKTLRCALPVFGSTKRNATGASCDLRKSAGIWSEMSVHVRPPSVDFAAGPVGPPCARSQKQNIVFSSGSMMLEACAS